MSGVVPGGGAAVIVGAGPGLGAALARRFAAGGCAVAVASRDAGRAEALAASAGAGVRGFGCDGTDEGAVDALFATVEAELGPVVVAVHNASGFGRSSILDASAAAFADAWRVSCLGAFLVGRAAARPMVARGQGTILFTGATASLRGGAGFAAFAAGKFGVRALAQSMARELGPKGVHVAHVVIDGPIDSERVRGMFSGRDADSLMQADDIAEAYWSLHRQGRSAWAQELDLRSWKEPF